MSSASLSPVSPVPAQQGALSEPKRLINVFFSPIQTFADIRRTSRWWSPFLIGCALSYLLVFAVSTKVGWSQATDNTLRMRPKQYERIQSLPPDQQAVAMGRAETFTKVAAYGTPLFFLIFDLIIAGVLLATFNFGLGTELKYSEALAILCYSGLVIVFKKSILGTITVFAGMNAESFNFDNFVGSNPAYYMSFSDTPAWLYNLLSYVDLFTIWAYVLVGVGFAVAGKKKISTGIAIMMGWYAIVVLVSTGFTALMS